MMDAELTRFIREEVKRQLNVVLNAQAGSNDEQTEVIDALYPGMPGIGSRPVVHPYGFASRATAGTISVTVRTGEHPGNRMVIGHRSAARPKDLSEGETIIFSKGDYRIKIENGQVLVGKGTDYEPVVVGETLRQFLISLVNLVILHTHEGNLGYETSEPLNFQDFQDLREENLDNKKILAEDGGRY